MKISTGSITANKHDWFNKRNDGKLPILIYNLNSPLFVKKATYAL